MVFQAGLHKRNIDTKFTMVRKSAICISAASLIFLNAWVELFPGTADQYLTNYQPSFHALVSLWMNVFILAVILYFGHSWADKTSIKLGICLLSGLLMIGALVAPMNRLITQYSASFELVLARQVLGPKLFYSLTGIFVIITIVVIAKAPHWTYRVLRGGVIILLPLPILLSISIIRGIPQNIIKDPVQAISQPLEHRTKVVVLVFDEWDYEYTFTQRPPQIALPGVDRFSNEYFTFTHCWPPAGETTHSIPSLVTGKRWKEAKFWPNGDVALKAPDQDHWQLWSGTPDLFSNIEKSGWNSRMIQWWHVFGPAYKIARPSLSISHYDADPRWSATRVGYTTFTGSVARQWFAVWKSYFSYVRWLFPSNLVLPRVDMIKEMNTDLLDSIQCGRYDLVWAHLPFPHSPAVFRSSTHAFLDRTDSKVSNLENMSLVDDTLIQVRQTLENKGDWDNALIILTSDHWQRELSGDHFRPAPSKFVQDLGLRVPLLVKLPHEHEASRIETPTCNVMVRSIIEETIKGKINDKDSLLRYYSPLPNNNRELLLDSKSTK